MELTREELITIICCMGVVGNEANFNFWEKFTSEQTEFVKSELEPYLDPFVDGECKKTVPPLFYKILDELMQRG